MPTNKMTTAKFQLRYFVQKGGCFINQKNRLLPLANQEKRERDKKQTLWPLFMDGVQLPQVYRATTRR